MVHSTWGDWFVTEEVEAVRPSGVSVWYLGCNGFIVRSAETTLYIDPYFGDGDPPNVVRMIPVPVDPADVTLCDAVLVTHEHIDHTHPPSYGPLVEDLGAAIHAPSAAYTDPDYDGPLRAPADRRHTVAVGDRFTVGDFTVHVRGANDPDAIEPVTYVIEHDTGVIVHPGDSRPAEAFHEIGESFEIDLGVLAVGSKGQIHYPDAGETRRTEWYMSENQAIEAANALRLGRLLPSHFDIWRGMNADPKSLHEHATAHEYPHVIETPRVGDRFDLARPGTVRPMILR
ncbi:MAG: putative Zn-dependent hydrolase [Halorubrum sp. J07HR59]|jgi:Predicted Zn-dependent hydrolases of the beta-lactamase fold|nr:MAG: putative Zn-dependent hydrolase [halophilic archaeon J07HX5]ERH04856.1 MAG: putative Zn-dependent hydrolase [Halorubrum sp. J07HR59]